MSQAGAEHPEASNSDAFLPQNLSLPSYVPLNRNFHRDFDKIFRTNASTDMTTPAINQHRLTAKNYINYILENESLEFDEKTLNNFALGYKQILESRCNLKKFESIGADRRITDYLNTSQPLTLDTLDMYHSMNKPSYEELLSEVHNLSSTAEVQAHLKSDEFYQLLRSIAYVIKHPEESVPDEFADNDDDVGISGGVVSLKDPLTLNSFVDPVVAPCGHTFESSSILQQLEQHSSGGMECPIGGCDATLQRGNLKPDTLMRIRIRSANKQQKSNRDLDIVH
ncbi:hypothetical protein KGF57_004692 [Candida theae]|uniref:SP-RING-type domain-containing protein n=1 Tax=Candida theae TaxID=1198502 RepID=A0AAD5FWV5_9ASCO|nr:uncharacterized protein KGF57_004692 [Candida theae]KAI5949482.1 hypothetical protein KGF57_004692 [Candida theae]